MLPDAPDTHAIHPPRRRGQTTNRRHRPAWRHHLLAHWRARTIRVIRPESCAPFPSHAPHPVCKQTVGRGRPTARGSRKSGVPRRRSWHQKDRGRLFPDPPLHLSSSALVLDRPQSSSNIYLFFQLMTFVPLHCGSTLALATYHITYAVPLQAAHTTTCP